MQIEYNNNWLVRDNKLVNLKRTLHFKVSLEKKTIVPSATGLIVLKLQDDHGMPSYLS